MSRVCQAGFWLSCLALRQDAATGELAAAAFKGWSTVRLECLLLATDHGRYSMPNAARSNGVMELARGVRSQLQALVSGLAGADLTPMSLGLSHSLSRYKLKFSPDKVRRPERLNTLFCALAVWHRRAAA